MEDEKAQLQEKLMQFEYMKAQAEAIEKQSVLINNTIKELEVTKHALDSFSKMSEGSEMLVPLGGGAYAYAKLADTKHVLINLGAGVLARKSIKEGVKIAEDQMGKLMETQNRLSAGMTELGQALNVLIPEVQILSEKVKQV